MTERPIVAFVVVLLLAASMVDLPAQSPTQAGAARAGRALLMKARAARGGDDRLSAIRAIEVREADRVTTVLWPDVYRIDLLAPFGRIRTVFDGADLWQEWPAGVPAPPAPARDAAIAGARGTLARFALMYLTEPSVLDGVSPIATGRQTWGPVSGEVVRLVPASGTVENAWGLVLADDMLPAALLAPSRTSPDGPATGYTVTVLQDYREVSGVRFPYQAQAYRVDRRGAVTQALASTRLEGLVVNPPVSRAELVTRR